MTVLLFRLRDLICRVYGWAQRCLESKETDATRQLNGKYITDVFHRPVTCMRCILQPLRAQCSHTALITRNRVIKWADQFQCYLSASRVKFWDFVKYVMLFLDGCRQQTGKFQLKTYVQRTIRKNLCIFLVFMVERERKEVDFCEASWNKWQDEHESFCAITDKILTWNAMPFRKLIRRSKLKLSRPSKWSDIMSIQGSYISKIISGWEQENYRNNLRRSKYATFVCLLFWVNVILSHKDEHLPKGQKG